MFLPIKKHLYNIILVSFMLFQQACANKGDVRSQKISMDSIQSEPDHAKVKKKKKKKNSVKTSRRSKSLAKENSKKLNSNVTNHCTDLYNSVSLPYSKLLSKADPGSIVADNSPLFRITRMNPRSCFSPKTVKNSMKIAYSAINNHKVKIGIILPLTGPKSDLSTFILQGIKASIEDAGFDYKAQVIVKDDRGDPSLTEKKLSELIFRDRITTVIGGLDDPTAKVLAEWADQIQISTFLLTRDRDLVMNKTHAFRIYPDQKRLAQTLAHSAKQNNFKKVAILRPANQKSDKLSNFFADYFVSSGGKIADNYIYTPNDFESMNAIARQLFKIDVSTRRDELKRAYDKQRKISAAEGVPFNARMVSLPPIVDFDAVFIPDDFRTIKYFTKLFKYHGVQNIGLLGNHEWRSPALIYPWDDILENAIFADFIGKYTQIPAAIASPTAGSPFFVHSNNVVPIDFRLIGYKAGTIASFALKNPRIQRRLVSRAMANLSSFHPQLFGSKSVFAEDHSVAWPTYVFKIKDKKFLLENDDVANREAKVFNKFVSPQNYRHKSRAMRLDNSHNSRNY